MDVTTIRASDLNEEQLRTFRRAARERGAEAVVEWEGSPYLVTEQRGDGEDEAFVLEPIPRPFG